MTKLSFSLLGVAMLWSATSLYARHTIESHYPIRTAEMAKNNMFNINIKKQNIDVGFLTTVATTDYEVQTDACDHSKSLYFTVKETFRNDIVTGLGSIRSNIEIISGDPKFNNDIEKLKQKIGKDLLEIKGKYSLNGTANYEINSPAFNAAENDIEIRWGGMTGNIMANAKELTVNVNSPSLAFAENNATNILFSGFKIDNKTVISDIGLNTGHSTVSLDRFELTPSKPSKYAKHIIAEKFNFHNEVNQNGVLANAITNNTIGHFQIDSLLKQANLSAKFALNNVDAKGLKAFSEAMTKYSHTCKAKLDDYDDAFKALLKGKPEFLIDHIKVTFEDSKAELSGHIKGVDLDQISKNTVDALRQIDGLKGLDMKLKVKTNDAVIAHFDNNDNSFGQIIDNFISANILKRENDGYSLDIDYQDSELKFNGMSLEALKLALQTQNYLARMQELSEQATEIPTEEAVEEEEPTYYTPNSSY